METLTLLENIYKLMDFDPAFTDKFFVIDEFKSKYGNSYVLIDDNIHLLDTIVSDEIITIENVRFLYHNKHTIKPFNLKPGLYTDRQQQKLCYVHKYPARQYCKGVRLGITHSIIPIVGHINLKHMVYAGNHFLINGEIYIYYRNVGTYKDEVITLHPEYKHLKNECEELWPLYLII